MTFSRRDFADKLSDKRNKLGYGVRLAHLVVKTGLLRREHMFIPSVACDRYYRQIGQSTLLVYLPYVPYTR